MYPRALKVNVQQNLICVEARKPKVERKKLTQ